MDALANEAREMLEGVGAENVRVEKDTQGYLVAATFTAEGFDGQPHAGHTAIDPKTSDDPRDMAGRLILLSRAGAERLAAMRDKVNPPAPEPAPPIDGYDTPEAEATEEPTFAPEDDPFGAPSPHDEIAMPASVDAGSYDETADEPRDADYTESSCVVEDDLAYELDAADFGAELADVEEETQAQFIFGDNLALDRLVRIGQLADEADARIAEARAAVNWSDSEFAAVQSHVTTNMDKATGMYAGGVQALYDRFVQLSEVQALEHRISQHRDAQQMYIRSAGHEAVATFDPGAGWP